MVMDAIQEHVKLLMVYHRQTGTGAAAVEVGSWETAKYLDVMESRQAHWKAREQRVWIEAGGSAVLYSHLLHQGSEGIVWGHMVQMFMQALSHSCVLW
jgi:hypothetical protein